jgi:MSHA biogenesis protein MshI
MIPTMPWLKKHQCKPGRLGIAVGPDGIAVAYVNDQKELGFHQFFDQPGDTHELFEQLVAEHNWQGQPCSLVLHPAYYQLLLTDSPTVEPEEMGQAVRWKVKELLDFPLEQAAIDHFALPEDAYRGRQKMVYVAALQKTLLQNLVEPLDASGLELDCIEVAELALNNVASRHQHETGAFAVLKLFGAEGFINMVEDGNLYLSRRFDVGLDEFLSGVNPQGFLDSLLLEIQRSLDYFESQLGKGIVTHLFYSPGVDVAQPVGKFLSEQLGLHVLPLDIAEVIEGTMSEQVGQCAAAIGAALGPQKDQEDSRAAY